MTYFTATCALIFWAEKAKTFRTILVNTSPLLKVDHHLWLRPLSSSWLARRHLLWVEVASLPLGIFPPKTKRWSHQALSWPLLARAFFLWPPLEGQRTPDKRTLSLFEMGHSRGSREHSGLHVQTATENVLDRDTERWSWKGANLSS